MKIEPVTVVVSRKVKAGREADYEAWINEVTRAALKYEGHLGMNIFKPQRSGDPYVLVYKFDSGAHLDAWLRSPERARLVPIAEQMADESHAEHVTGLESWFTLPGASTSAMVPPPRWKMALVTGTVVFAMSQTIAPLVRWSFAAADLHAPAPIVGLITTVVMVALLTWVVMPRVTKLLAKWLYTHKG